MKKADIVFIIIILFLMIISIPSKGQDFMRATLKDRVVMKTEQLKVRDIVDPKETDIAFIRQYGDIQVSGDADTLDFVNRSRLYALLHDHGADLDRLHIRMNAGVEIERGQAIELNKNAVNGVIKAVSAAFNIPAGDIRIARSRILPKVPADSIPSLYFKAVEMLDLASFDNARFTVRVENADGEETEHTLFVNLDIETAILMMKEDMAAGDTLSSEDFVTGRQKIKSLKGRIVRDKDILSRTFKYQRDVKKDEILMGDMLRESVLIGEGTLVTIKYKTPYLSISALGKIQGSGEIGKVVRVENVDSKRVITGMLVSPDVVEVGHD